jgi:hypothetical protein
MSSIYFHHLNGTLTFDASIVTSSFLGRWLLVDDA